MADNDEELTALIRSHAQRYTASEALRAAVRTEAALAGVSRGSELTVKRRTKRTSLPQRVAAQAQAFVLRWSKPGLGFALGVACAWIVPALIQHSELGESLESRFLTSHVQAMGVGPLVQVASSDRHTVKPWFQGRIDFAPPVPDFVAEGFPLKGGRIERHAGQSVAVLTYGRNQHVIDVYIRVSSAQYGLLYGLQRGFSIHQWADASMHYAVVSDLERADSQRFAELWVEQGLERSGR